MRRHRSSAQPVFAALTVLLVGLAACVAGEIALRWRHGKIEHITGAAEWEIPALGELTYFWDAYHPLYGWTNRAGYRSDERVPFRVTVNSQGLRGTEEHDPLPPPGTRRIAMFGDSFTFGEEVNDDQTIPAYLERYLDGSPGRGSVEVLNFGVHGFGLGQMMLRLEQEGFAFHPHHVVLALLIPEDLYRDPLSSFVHNKPAFSLEDWQIRIHNVPVPEASRQPWLYRHSFLAAWLLARPAPGSRPRTDLPFYLNLALELTSRVAHACLERGIPWTLVTVVDASTLEALETDPVVRDNVSRIRAALGERAVDHLDLTAYLDRLYRQEGRGLVAPHGHWTARANCLVAAAIAAHLRDKDAAGTREPAEVACPGPA